ncbi:hypothetical protein HO173_010058 [Letharia columbiana]|uniref:Uncharacterized protein n=1 Tax=Letharia columbiana TaxID=112416 RepID=A0A8H6FNH1_9LECA|nr:uncharacterized protein HO173_010058 [Letharia columbiana]KAF6231756.1 hypothetical protein HO173_010058 [Letharia columbiana]
MIVTVLWKTDAEGMVIDELCKERWKKPTWAAQMAYERNSKAKARSAETGELFVPTDPQLKARHFKKIAWTSYVRQVHF